MLKQILGDLMIIAVGLLILYLPFYMLNDEGFNPYKNYQLIRYGRITRGVVLDSWSDVVESNDGRSAGLKYYCKYRFSDPNGHAITECCSTSGELSGLVEIEYVPSTPSINRIRGTGYTTMNELCRRSLIGVVFILMLSIPGGVIVKTGFVSLVKAIKGLPVRPAQ